MDRKTKLSCMRDILEHLGDCFDQWQGAEGRSERFLAESIERDVSEFRRLCDSVRNEVSRPSLRSVAAA